MDHVPDGVPSEATSRAIADTGGPDANAMIMAARTRIGFQPRRTNATTADPVSRGASVGTPRRRIM
jgi:hypothetical protein